MTVEKSVDTIRIGIRRVTDEGIDVYSAIPTNDIKHAIIVGATGWGKTEIQKLIVSECIKNGYGFLVIDPHGTLSEYVAGLCASKNLDFIHIAPRLTMKLQRTVKINPLDIDRERVNTLISQLKSLSPYWGQRLEAILRNTFILTLSLPKENRNINTSRRIIINDDYLASSLVKVVDEELHMFWEDTFPKYGSEAATSAYNKIDAFMTNPMVRAVVDTSIDMSDGDNSLDFDEVIKNKQRVILDVSEIDYESASFIGSIAIMMLYSKVQRMIERRDRKENPFFIIVDEAQQFAPDLREPLNMFRKFNIKMIMGTQTLVDKRIPFADEIIELTSLVCAFKIGAETAHLIKPLLHETVKDKMANMPKYKFSAYAGPDMNGVLTTKKMVLPEPYSLETEDGRRNIMKAIESSIERHGVKLQMEKYLPKQREVQTKLSVLQHAVMCFLWKNGQSYNRQALYDKLADEFEIESKDIKYAVNEIMNMGNFYLQHSEDTLALVNVAMDEFFLDIPKGQRGGSDKHTDVISQIAKYSRQRYSYVILDTGGGGGAKPDVLVIPYRNNIDTKVIEWDYDNIRVFEVETDPNGHREQVFKNWSKNYSIGYQVNFVVFSERDRGHVMNILTEKGIQSQQYRVWLVDELPKPDNYSALIKHDLPTGIPQELPIESPKELPILEDNNDDYKNLKAQLRANPTDETVVEKLRTLGFNVTKIEDGKKWRIRKGNIDNEVTIIKEKKE